MDLGYFYSYADYILNWIKRNVLVTTNLIELVIIVMLLVLARILVGRIRPQLEKLSQVKGSQKELVKLLKKLLFPVVFGLFLWAYVVFAIGLRLPLDMSRMVANLISAWVGVSIISAFLKDKVLARVIAFFIWMIAALNILNIYDSTVTVLDSWAVRVGELHFSFLTVTKGVILFTVLLWAAKKVTGFLGQRINQISDLNPSLKVLAIKLLNFIIFTIVGFIALESIGIKLTTLTVFGGAIGLGLGFGLQKVVSNYISGIIILLDKSVKPGDVIEIGGVYGWVTSLNLRFVSVVTREGKEYLVPNEEFITQKVINWSYTDNRVRVVAPVGIAYGCDVEFAMQLMLEAVKGIKRICPDPEPICLLVGFGDSAVKLELRFWISDPEKGIDTVRSEVYLAVWHLFKQHRIEIPYPQQDLHIRSIQSQQKPDTESIRCTQEMD